MAKKRSRKRKVEKNEGVNWKRVGKSFRKLLKRNEKEIKRLCDARTYRDLYLEDGVKPPC